MNALTILTYHYVRDQSRSKFPALKARDLFEFERQLDHIASCYSVVTAQQALAALHGNEDLPANAIWLTFDDGYIDHYTYVFPRLHRRGWQGSFFVPARAIIEREVLDVNKIHFLLASTPEGAARIVDEIHDYIGGHVDGGLSPFDYYWQHFAKPSRFDGKDIVFIKRVLQDALPELHRSQLLNDLFLRYVTKDQTGFAAELYLSSAQIHAMVDGGMYFGGHGFNHVRLASISRTSQIDEVDRTRSALQRMIGLCVTLTARTTNPFTKSFDSVAARLD